MKNPVKFYLFILLSFFVLTISADDNTASQIYSEGRQLYLDGEYYDAAQKFESCRFHTKNMTIRANSLIAQAASYRMCKLYYREFLAIEELLERYPEYVNCKDMIAREFEIGQIFRGGYREPAFWVFRWIPYLVDVNRTEEVFSAALKRAPYSEYAPGAHMQLAIFFDQEGETQKSVAELRMILERHGKSEQSKYALLALANALFNLAGRGDGDSRYINESVELFKLFCQRYPDASEIEFARNRLAQAKDVQAKKLFEIAEFYRKNGRKEVAERYLAQVMNEYPDSKTAPNAEAVLVDISDNFLPAAPQEKIEARMPDLKSYSIPDEPGLLLAAPGENGNHFLLNVPDIKGEVLKDLSGNNGGEK